MCEASASHDVSYNYSTRYDSQPKRKNKPSNELSVCSGLATACTAGALVWGLATATAVQQASRSFLSVPVPSRQEVGRRSWVAALVVPGLAHAEVDNPLPPPVVKDLERAAPKIQGGVDWFYFELLPAIKKEEVHEPDFHQILSC
eukprot:s645_g16.t4